MKKIILYLIVLLFGMTITGCGNISDAPTNGKDLSTLTPQEVLDTAFLALKNADAATFNACVVYPDEKHNNVYFGDGMEDDDGYMTALFGSLSYEIETTDEQKDTTMITCQIKNKDFRNLDMERYVDAENPMVSAIKNSNADILTQKIDIKLEKVDNQWQIMIDDNFTNAISGGHWNNTWW